MKKLLLLLLLYLSSINSINAADDKSQVNLSCAIYETFHWDNLTTSKTKPEDESLILYLDIEMYTYDGVTGYFDLIGNEIKFSLYSGDEDFSMKWDYSLDRTTSVFEYDVSVKTPNTGNEYEMGLTHKGKCRRSENLF